MTDSSRLIPSKLKAQSEAAITRLQAYNESLRVSNVALDAFINDDTNRSKRFNNAKRKMEDYKLVSNAFIQANDSDIAEHRMLADIVGDIDLVGAAIFHSLDINMRDRYFAEDRVAHYRRVQHNVTILQRLNPFDRTLSNAQQNQRNWERLLENIVED